MDYQIEDIETGILDALRNYEGMPNGVTIEPYQGQIEDMLKELDSGVLGSDINPPAILVCYAGSSFTENAHAEEQYFSLACISSDLRGKEDVRAGMYQILTATKKALKGNNLGLDIEPLIPQEIDLKLSLRDISIFSFTFKTFFAIS